MKTLRAKRTNVSSLLILALVAVGLYLWLKSKQPVALAAPTIMENEEKWKWVDWKGRDRQITVSRHVALPGAKNE